MPPECQFCCGAEPPPDMATRGQVLVVVFGQELPDAASSAALQLFSLIVAAVGFASFALVLALVEQVVLQVLDTNVRQGGPVYEDGHILVLSLADNQRDQEVIWKILSQVCRQTTTTLSATHGGALARLLCQLHNPELLADLSQALSRSPGSGFWCQPDCTEHMARCTRAPQPPQPAHGCRQPAAGSLTMAAGPATELKIPDLQVCMAYRTEGGRCVVILCQREKLAMEADFRRILPPERRHGTRFVFRQGLPMIPDDLRLVAASRTSATIVISDSSRPGPASAAVGRHPGRSFRGLWRQPPITHICFLQRLRVTASMLCGNTSALADRWCPAHIPVSSAEAASPGAEARRRRTRRLLGWRCCWMSWTFQALRCRTLGLGTLLWRSRRLAHSSSSATPAPLGSWLCQPAT